MMQQLHITMIHDVVCSWCHIGYAHLSRALDSLENEITSTVSYVPFQLNPRLGPRGVEINEHLRERNGWNEQQTNDYRKRLLNVASLAKVEFDFARRTHYYNSAKAHGLMLLAEQVGMQRKAHKLLLQAYHIEGKDISNEDTLTHIGRTIGLSENALAKIFSSQDLPLRLTQKAQTVAQFQPIKSVPAFVFNNELFVPDSNSEEFFINLIRKEFIDTATTTRRAKA